MLQSQNEMLNADRLTKPYKGIIDCAVQIYCTEGMANLLNYSQIICDPPSKNHFVGKDIQSLNLQE